jgi:protein SCO1/2
MVACTRDTANVSGSCCKNENKDKVIEGLSGESVYQLQSEWTSQMNERFKLEHFRGKVVIAAMVFTHCESACPRIVADMKRVEAGLSAQEIERITFLLISMDPERDTPERMKEFAAGYKLNAGWTLIRSGEDETQEIANVLGVRIIKLETGGFDHSNIIHVINRGGEIVHQQIGFAVEQEETLQSVKRLLKE